MQTNEQEKDTELQEQVVVTSAFQINGWIDR